MPAESTLTEFSINGKQVKLRKRITGSTANKFPALLNAVGKDDATVTDYARFLRVVVEEWDFEGAPDDLRSYDEMDFLDEILPLMARVGEYVKKKTEYAGAKN